MRRMFHGMHSAAAASFQMDAYDEYRLRSRSGLIGLEHSFDWSRNRVSAGVHPSSAEKWLKLLILGSLVCSSFENTTSPSLSDVVEATSTAGVYT